MERLGILSHDQQRHDCNLASQKATHPPRYLLKPHLNTDPQHRIAVLAEPSMPSPHRAAIWPSLTASAQGSPPPHYRPSVTNGKSQRGSPILHAARCRVTGIVSAVSTKHLHIQCTFCFSLGTRCSSRRRSSALSPRGLGVQSDNAPRDTLISPQCGRHSSPMRRARRRVCFAHSKSL
jgi:hypothetical protein